MIFILTAKENHIPDLAACCTQVNFDEDCMQPGEDLENNNNLYKYDENVVMECEPTFPLPEDEEEVTEESYEEGEWEQEPFDP